VHTADEARKNGFSQGITTKFNVQWWIVAVCHIVRIDRTQHVFDTYWPVVVDAGFFGHIKIRVTTVRNPT
jgi:hypothetical protein